MGEKLVYRIIMSPFALLYGLVISIRLWMYRVEWIKGAEFNLPVISIGNLTVGGSGKTPHIEYLIRHFKVYLQVATLSRGYGRKTKGYYDVHPLMTPEQVGDEPLEFKRKFPDVDVAVCESRSIGIPELKARHPEIQMILLDDAFQHLAVKPGLNILLTEYSQPYPDDYILPVGRLREWRSGYKRADLIVVSKCPADLKADEAEALKRKLAPLPEQKVFFSTYAYQHPYALLDRRARILLDEDIDVILLSAIARTEYLEDYLLKKINSLHTLNYRDHHLFTKQDMEYVKKVWDNHPSDKKIILTTEKDAIRLEMHRAFFQEHQLPIFVLPVEVNFLFEEQASFNKTIEEYLLDFKV